MFYTGFCGIFVLGLGATAAGAPRAVVVAILVVTFAVAAGGLVIFCAGSRIDDRDLAEYHRKAEAGEVPAWKPGDPDPLG